MKAIVTVPRFDPAIPTLGFGVIRWIQANLVQGGEPFTLSAEQRRFLLWYYALNPDGTWRYVHGVLRRSKGWGKSPFVGAICLAELCGPTSFDRWAADGTPIGVRLPSPWVAVAGVSQDQTRNTMLSIRSLAQKLSQDNGGPLDIGIEQIRHADGGHIASITASAKSQEGARTTFAVADELHHWTESNGGHGLFEVMERNLAKMGGRMLETTNAHEPDQDSSAERTYRMWIQQRDGLTPEQNILYDCREVTPLTVDELADPDTLAAALKLAYGDSTWVPIAHIQRVIYKMADPNQVRRFYLNQIVAASDAWLAPAVYEANVSKFAPLAPLEPGTTITLGFDGALTDDSTALVACRVSDGAPFLLGLWEKPTGPAGEGWSVEKPLVRSTVEHAFATYDVVGFFSDVAYWETDVDAWHEQYHERLLVKAVSKHSVAWDMRGHQQETVAAVMALHRAFTDQEIPMPTDDQLRRHVLNARRRPNRWGISFGKPSRESPHKVDALAALLLARMARTRVLTEGAMGKRRTATGTLVGFGRGGDAVARRQAEAARFQVQAELAGLFGVQDPASQIPTISH